MQKSIITVKNAVFSAWESSGRIVHAIILIETVRGITARPMLHDGTILRKLRELRSEGKLDYIVKSKQYSIYEKK